jgi:hypothetical protein
MVDCPYGDKRYALEKRIILDLNSMDSYFQLVFGSWG